MTVHPAPVFPFVVGALPDMGLVCVVDQVPEIVTGNLTDIRADKTSEIELSIRHGSPGENPIGRRGPSVTEEDEHQRLEKFQRGAVQGFLNFVGPDRRTYGGTGPVGFAVPAP